MRPVLASEPLLQEGPAASPIIPQKLEQEPEQGNQGSSVISSIEKQNILKPSHKIVHLSPDLGHLFEKLIRSWGADHVRHLESTFDEKTDLPMERMALLSGTLKGILVARSTREFPAWLQNQRDSLIPAHFSEAEAFEEMISLFALYLSHDFWVPESFTVGPLHPFPSIPLDWPEEKPSSSCAILVEGLKVEIRFWKKD